MTLHDVKGLLNADILYGEDLLDTQVEWVSSADMMSDVLAYSKPCSVLLTGLCNPQVIRTAEMMDIICVVFVRGKVPTDDMLALVRGKKIVLMSTRLYMFSACGILYERGFQGGCLDE